MGEPHLLTPQGWIGGPLGRMLIPADDPCLQGLPTASVPKACRRPLFPRPTGSLCPQGLPTASVPKTACRRPPSPRSTDDLCLPRPADGLCSQGPTGDLCLPRPTDDLCLTRPAHDLCLPRSGPSHDLSSKTCPRSLSPKAFPRSLSPKACRRYLSVGGGSRSCDGRETGGSRCRADRQMHWNRLLRQLTVGQVLPPEMAFGRQATSFWHPIQANRHQVFLNVNCHFGRH